MNTIVGPDSVDNDSAIVEGAQLSSVSNRELRDRNAVRSLYITECSPRCDHRNMQNQSGTGLLPTGAIKHHDRSGLIYSQFRDVECIFVKIT